MKKYLLTALVLVFGVASRLFAAGGPLNVPVGPPGWLPIDTSGVAYSTVSYSSANVLLGTGQTLLVGVIVGSFTIAEVNNQSFIMWRDTDTILNNTESGGQGDGEDFTVTNEICRVYLSTQAGTLSGTSTDLGQASYGMTYFFSKPIRTKTGAAAKASWSTSPLITHLYQRLYVEDNTRAP